MAALFRWFRVSPLGRRRLRIFYRNRPGFLSLLFFLGLLGLSLCSEFIANDRPLLVRFRDAFFFPVFVDYAETDFGGTFETEADYHDPFLLDLIRSEGWVLWPPIPYSYDTHVQDLGAPAPTPPDGRHWLGTDDQGRDVVARVLYGLRLSILFGLTLTFFSSIIGIGAGVVQGFFGGLIDLIGQRLIEIWQSMPSLYILIIVASVIRINFWWLLGILLLFSWTALVAVVRAEVLRVRKLDYVLAARALGLSNGRLMRRHILPNAFVAGLTLLPFIASGSLVALTSLDFLGLGLPPGSASLGELLNQGYRNLHAPWLALAGFVVTGVLLTLLILIGQAVRDAFDPRHGVSSPA